MSNETPILSSPLGVSHSSIAAIAVRWGPLVGLLLVTACCYWRILDTFFVQDDFFLLRAVRQSMPNRAMWQGVCFFRPLSTYWLPWLNVSLWGFRPFPHHAVGLALFLATIGFLFDWLRRLTGSNLAALAGASLYAFSKTHLYTLAWIAGGIDLSAAFFLVLGLWIVERYFRRADCQRRLLWAIGVVFVCGLLCKESCIVLAPACWVWIAARKIASRRPLDSAEKKLAVMLLAIVVAYLPLWKCASTVSGTSASQLRFDPSRTAKVLQDSVIAAMPAAEPRFMRSNAWFLLPLGLLALAMWPVGGSPDDQRSCAPIIALAFVLWLAPASIFAFTKYPWALQLYYAHFSVIGLAVMAALAIGRFVSAKPRWSWTSRKGLRLAIGRPGVVVAASLVVWVVLGGQTIHEGIRNRASPAMCEADVAARVHRQLKAAIDAGDYRRIVFLDVAPMLRAPMHDEDMVAALFPGIQATYVGRDGFESPCDVQTSTTTLVVRAGNQSLTVVR